MEGSKSIRRISLGVMLETSNVATLGFRGPNRNPFPFQVASLVFMPENVELPHPQHLQNGAAKTNASRNTPLVPYSFEIRSCKGFEHTVTDERVLKDMGAKVLGNTRYFFKTHSAPNLAFE